MVKTISEGYRLEFSGCVLTPPRGTYFHIPRRLVDFSAVRGTSEGTYTSSFGHGGTPRLHRQQSQITSHAYAAAIVPGSGPGLGTRHCHTHAGEGGQAGSRGLGPDGLGGGTGTNVDEVPRADGQYGRHRALVSSAHETDPVVSGGFLSGSVRRSGDVRASGPGHTFSSQVVDQPGEPPCGSEVSDASPTGDANNRRVLCRLGGARGRSNGQRGVDAGSGGDAHQCVGADRGRQVDAGPTVKGGRETSVSQIGQRDHSLVHQQARWYAVPDTVLPSNRSTSVVSRQGHPPLSHAYSGHRQRNSRQSVPGPVSPPDRVVAGSAGGSSGVRAPRTATDRFVCDKAQQTTPGVLHAKSRRGRVRGGLSVDGLDGVVRVRLPADTTVTQSSGKDISGTMRDHPHRAVLAPSAMVPAADKPSCGRTATSPVTSGPPGNAREQGQIPRHQRPQVDCMAVIRDRFVKAGFSQAAANFASAGRRQSTLQVYTARLRPYYAWCDERGVDPTSASVPQVAEFLCYIFKRNIQASTVSGYLSAILSIHEGTPDGLSLRHDNSLKLLIEGFHNSNPPPRKVWPSWDLEKVLDALNTQPYEPALAATLRNCTIKTAFLLALASGRRASELHALSIGEHIVWHSRGGVSLYFRPSFLAKNERSNFVAKPISLPRLGSEAGERRLSCPVRSLKWYLKKSELVRGGIKQLFVTTNNPTRPAAKSTLAGWVVAAIVNAEAIVGEGRPKAHSVRAEATSTAFHRGLSIQDVVDTVSWKSDHVFVSTYLKDRPPESAGKRFARTVLGQRS